jgi:RimJ/RimL family protein N-acetyltransferase
MLLETKMHLLGRSPSTDPVHGREDQIVHTTEIAQALVRYGFEELEFSEVWASMNAPNAASVCVLEKAGLRLERWAVVDGLETLFYCLPRSAFQPGGYR